MSMARERVLRAALAGILGSRDTKWCREERVPRPPARPRAGLEHR